MAEADGSGVSMATVRIAPFSTSRSTLYRPSRSIASCKQLSIVSRTST